MSKKYLQIARYVIFKFTDKAFINFFDKSYPPYIVLYSRFAIGILYIWGLIFFILIKLTKAFLNKYSFQIFPFSRLVCHTQNILPYFGSGYEAYLSIKPFCDTASSHAHLLMFHREFIAETVSLWCVIFLTETWTDELYTLSYTDHSIGYASMVRSTQYVVDNICFWIHNYLIRGGTQSGILELSKTHVSNDF